MKDIKIAHNRNMIKAKVRSISNFELLGLMEKYWMIESSYDKSLYKEDIGIIKLRYEHLSKWMILQNASFLGFFAIFITTWSKLGWILWFFILISLIISFLAIWILNVRFNKTYNTLLKKQRDIKDKN